MSEVKLPRLLAAAREFNVGQETIVDYLVKKGFNKDDLKPTAKLTEKMYSALQAEFQSDKVAKNKADQVKIPKSSVSNDSKKKKEDEEQHQEELSLKREKDGKNSWQEKLKKIPEVLFPRFKEEKQEEPPAPKPEIAPEISSEDKIKTPTTPPAIVKKEEIQKTPTEASSQELISKADPIQPKSNLEETLPKEQSVEKNEVHPIEEAPVREKTEPDPAPAVKAEKVTESAKPKDQAQEKSQQVTEPEKQQVKESISPIITVDESKQEQPIVPKEEAQPIIKETAAIETEQKEPSEKKPVDTKLTDKVVEEKEPIEKVGGLKILDKIDLGTIDSSTRPRRNHEEKSNTRVPQRDVRDAKQNSGQNAYNKPRNGNNDKSNRNDSKAPRTDHNDNNRHRQERNDHKQKAPGIINPPKLGYLPGEEKNPHPKEISADPTASTTIIQNIEVEKLTGPKILGKIQLPLDNDTRPKNTARSDEKRKRKRIPIDKRTNNNDNRGTNNNPNNGPRTQHGPQTAGDRNDRRPGQGGQSNNGNTRNNNTNNRPGVRNNAPNGNNNGNNRNNNFRTNGPNNRRPHGRIIGHDFKKEEKEIDAKEIQEKIRETQAKLAGTGNRGKSARSKYRRAKREEAAEAMNANESESNILHVTEFVTVSELANLMNVNFTDVISKCMNLGILVSINQRLDAEVIELVAGEFGFEVAFTSMEDAHKLEEEEEEDSIEDTAGRSPIVTIMGHVDHGKTSLLDYIRNTNVVAGEAGGITQHIGAYEVKLNDGKKITFLDTPGHEAFTAMRARGAQVTDMAVIVIAADDAVMPQTKEAISHAQAAGIPMIFAINKIDKDGANPQKIYEQLSQMNLLVEEWGGDYQSQEISAKKGLNIDKLLEKILLQAEMLDLKANAEKKGTGSIIEATLDKGRGYVATVLVLNGTLHQGDILVSGQHYGRIRAMFNERNLRIKEAGPSSPAVILGLNGAPQAGEKFRVYDDETEAKDIANKRAQILREQGLRARKHITLDEIGRRLALGNFKELNIIIKGDVDGSVEALSDSLQKLATEEIAVNVVHKAVGQISESDVLLATASDAILLGFNVRPSAQAAKLAQQEGVEIKMYSIIYNAIEDVKNAMEGMLEPKIQEKEIASVDVREVYKFDKLTVAGCYVTDGKMKRDSKIRLFRDGVLLFPRTEGAFAELGSLKRFKDDVKEVASSMECGLTIKNFSDLKSGDSIVAYEEIEMKRTL